MTTEHHSKLEPIILARVCEPVARHVPARVRPNDITLATHALSWSAFAVCVAAPSLTPGWALAARLVAALTTFGAMLTDCIDGMHARRTGQCSPLGEILDHWLGTVHVPLAAAGLLLTLGLDGALVALAMVTNVAVYEAQLVLYHHSCRFVHPPTAGTEAQLGVALMHGLLGLGFYLLPEHAHEVQTAGALVVGLGVLIQLRALHFYYQRLGTFVWRHLGFIVLTLVPTAVYMLGATSAITYTLIVTALSLRVSGSYVLRTVARRVYAGMDGWALGAALGWSALMLTSHPGGSSAGAYSAGAWAVAGALALSALAELRGSWTLLEG